MLALLARHLLMTPMILSPKIDMQLQHQTPLAVETPVSTGVAPAVDSSDALYTQRAQLKRERQAIDSQIKAIDEDIKPRMLEGERFGSETEELYILPVETTTCDWKAIVASGLLTKEQITPYLKRTDSTQIRSRKVETVTTYPEGSPEADDLRQRLENASKGLT